MMDFLTISVAEDKMFRIDPVIMETQVRVFDLFTNNETSNIVFMPTIHRLEFSDLEKQSEVSLALASTFTPSKLTAD